MTSKTMEPRPPAVNPLFEEAWYNGILIEFSRTEPEYGRAEGIGSYLESPGEVQIHTRDNIFFEAEGAERFLRFLELDDPDPDEQPMAYGAVALQRMVDRMRKEGKDCDDLVQAIDQAATAAAREWLAEPELNEHLMETLANLPR